jgi:hypothetical protein
VANTGAGLSAIPMTTRTATAAADIKLRFMFSISLCSLEC